MKIGIKQNDKEIVLNDVEYKQFLDLWDMCKQNNAILTIYEFEKEE